MAQYKGVEKYIQWLELSLSWVQTYREVSYPTHGGKQFTVIRAVESSRAQLTCHRILAGKV